MAGEKRKTPKERMEEFITLYQKYPRNLIKDKLNITDNTYDKMLIKAVAIHSKEQKQNTDVLKEMERNKPFSENEDDYVFNNQNRKRIITKEGLLDFEGNKPIEESITKLSVAAQVYKFTMEAYNIILPKISHENFYKYE
jgi:hypothetical protein